MLFTKFYMEKMFDLWGFCSSSVRVTLFPALQLTASPALSALLVNIGKTAVFLCLEAQRG